MQIKVKLKVPILMYHKIANPPEGSPNPHLYVTPENFAAQMDYLRRHEYHTLSLGDVGRGLKNGTKLPHRSVILTFDDGYLNNYENAFPVLQRYNLKTTIFLVADAVGHKVNWQLSRGATLAEPLLDWVQVEEMQRYGITFDSHTCTHPKLNQIPLDQARYEISASRGKLEDKLSVKVEGFCYPYGEYNPQVVDLVREAGYTAACVVDNGNRHSLEDVYTLKRVFIWSDTPLRRFAYYLTSLYDYEKAYKRWLKARRTHGRTGRPD